MEALVFLAIIAMVARSLYKNSKEARRKDAERRTAQGEETTVPQTKSGFPGSLSEWIEMLEGKAPMERKAPATSVPSQPRAKPAQSFESKPVMTYEGSVPQGVSTEGCQTRTRDCEAPRHIPQVGKWREAQAQQESPFSFLEGMPEVMKGVVYAEILTRPQQRRRLRP